MHINELIWELNPPQGPPDRVRVLVDTHNKLLICII
jgi:hypothetical protein